MRAIGAQRCCPLYGREASANARSTAHQTNDTWVSARRHRRSVVRTRAAAKVVHAPNNKEHGTDRHMKTANFPLDPEGRTYHLGTKNGEVANRVLAVGSLGRAHMLAELLTPLPGTDHIGYIESSRGFLTATGLYNGCPVSIVTHLMGFANIDLMLRETRAVSEAPMLVIRIGTCGSLNGKIEQVIVASEGSVAVLQDPDAFRKSAVNGHSLPPYRITQPVLPDEALSAALHLEMTALLGDSRVVTGLNASADSFFSSQGRTDSNFQDKNSGVIDMLMAAHPNVSSLEMETFHLLHLAECSKGCIRGAAAAISLANRITDEFIEPEKIPELELLAGTAALNALVHTHVIAEHAVQVPDDNVQVWSF